MDTIGKRMETLRKRVKREDRSVLGVTEAAELLGIKQPSLTAIEKGRTVTLAGETLARACNLYNTTPNFILYGIGHELDEESAMLESELVRLFKESPPEIRRSIVSSARGLAKDAQAGPMLYTQIIGDKLTDLKSGHETEVSNGVSATLSAKITKQGENTSDKAKPPRRRSAVDKHAQGVDVWSKKT